MTDHEVDTTITRLQPGTLVDITIKGVRVDCEHDHGSVSIRDEAGCIYLMPAQAAVKRANLANPIDGGTLQERITDAIRAIDAMSDEQVLDPWKASTIRQALDPNPRYWPPQAGDLWDDGMPFGGSLWFAREYPANPDDPDQTPKIGMVSVVASSREGLTPHGLLISSDTLKLVYRRKDDAR